MFRPKAYSIVTLVLASALLSLASATYAERERSGRELRDRSLDFEASGLQVGTAVPDFEITTLDGESVALSSLWVDKPTVLVTCSITCPVARQRMREVDRMRKHYGDTVNVVLLYTLEAHPKGSGSPYAVDRVEWLTKKNIDQSVYFPQPEAFDERIAHARRFVDRMKTKTPLYLDGMENEIWQTIGGGPNMGLLIGTDGKIHVKHGWFDGKTMYRSVEAYLGNPAPTRRGRRTRTTARRTGTGTGSDHPGESYPPR